MEDRKLDQLIINKLTAEQHQKLIENNEIAEDEIYLVPSIEEELQADVESLKEQQSSVNTNLSEINQKIQNNTVKIEENSTAISMNAQKIGENTAAIEENASQISQHKEEVSEKLSLVDQSLEELDIEIETVKGDLSSHATSSNSQFALVREEFAAQDAETLKTAKEHSDANKESAISSANEYTDQKIDELVNGTGLEGVVDTIKDINEAMAESSDMLEALETANSKKVDKGAKGSTIKPIYFDENGAQEIAYTIEKSVPADAKFTDTTYTLIKDATNKKIQLMNGDKLVSEVDDNNTTYEVASATASGLMSKEDKTKLDGIEVGADKTIVDGELSSESENPIQNKVVTEKIEEIESKDLFETKHEEGNAITISDSAEAPFVGMKLYGKTTQDGTPTPDAPVPLVSVGDSGSFEVGVYGRNFLENTNGSFGLHGATFTKNADGSVYVSGTPTEVGVQYWFDAHVERNLKKGETYRCINCGVQIKYKDGTFAYVSPFTYDDTVKEIGVYIQLAKGTTYNITYYPMVLKNTDKDNTWEPYNKQTLTMTYTLRGIGDIKDEVDFNRGVLIQRFKELTLNGSESWIVASKNRVYIDTISDMKPIVLDTVPPNAICDICGYAKKYANIYSEVDEGFSINIVGNLIFRFTEYTSSIDTWVAYLTENPITVIYELTTPIETPLTETELNAYRQLHTNKPNTTIISEADMEVDYVVDSTSAEYIENRLEEVKDKIPTKTSQLTNDSSFINQTGLNNALEDKLSFDEEIINSTSDVAKVVPEGSGKYAAINKVGGMSYKSRNLLEVTATSGTYNGITYTINTDKSITTSGTAQNNSTFIMDDTLQEKLSIGKTYNFVGYGGFQVVKTDGTSIYGKSFTYDSTVKQVIAYMQITNGTTVNATYYPMVIEATETNTSYEPYYSGLRNAYVSEIKSVGKNLLNLANSISGSGTYTIEDNKITFTGYDTFSNQDYFPFGVWVDVKPNTNYYIDFNSTSIGVIIIYTDKLWGNTFASLNFSLSSKHYFNSGNNKRLLLGFYSIGSQRVGTSETVSNIILSEGTEATQYEPYKENTFTIPTGAKGVGYGMGVNESCYNYVDFERKVYVQNCKKVNLGGLDWRTNQANRFLTDSLTLPAKPFGVHTMGVGLCDIYSIDTWDNINNGVNDKTIAAHTNSVYVCDLNYTDVESFKAAMTGVYLIYPLETPIETDISDYIQDNFIEIAEGGVITAVNEYGYNVPTEISFFTSENPEKVIVADKIVGDLVNEVEVAKTLNGQYIQNYYHIPADIVTNYGLLDIYQTTNYYNQSKVYIGVPIAIFDVDEDGNISATPLFKNAKTSSELVKNWYTYIMNNGSYDLIDNDIPIFPIVGGSLIFNNNMGLSGKGEWKSSFCTLNDAFNMFSNNLEISCNIISDSCLYISQNADQPTVVFGGYAIFNTDDTDGTLEETLNSFLALGAVRGIDFSIPVKDITITPVEFDASILG